MRVRLWLAVLLALLGGSAGFAAGTGAAPAGSYIVVLQDGVDPDAVAGAHQKRFGAQVQFVYRSALKGYAATLDSAAAAGIASDARVRWVEPDDVFSAPLQPRPPHASPKAPQPAQVLSNGLNRVDAEASSAVSGDGKGAVNANVAVLDGGLDRKHPDLNVGGGVNCVPGQRTTDFYDRDGHGTAVGGFIAALDNGIGRVGVAPGATLFGVRVLDVNGNGSDAMVLCGLDWVAATRTNANKTDDILVANMSLAGPSTEDGNCGLSAHEALHLAICRTTQLGVTVVVAASNDATDLVGTGPATFDEVLTVTALADYDGQPGGSAPANCGGFDDSIAGDDSPASFSDFATSGTDQAHTVAAPGVCVGSTFTDSTYAILFGGTSFASPIAAGTVVLCITAGPCSGMSPAQVIHKIVADAAAYNTAHPQYGFTGDPQHPIAGKYYGNLIRAGLY